MDNITKSDSIRRQYNEGKVFFLKYLANISAISLGAVAALETAHFWDSSTGSRAMKIIFIASSIGLISLTYALYCFSVQKPLRQLKRELEGGKKDISGKENANTIIGLISERIGYMSLLLAIMTFIAFLGERSFSPDVSQIPTPAKHQQSTP